MRMNANRAAGPPTTLLDLILEHLHTTAAPLLRFQEVEPFLRIEPHESLGRGVLVESAIPADEIPDPRHPGSGQFVGVRKTSRGWFAVALDEDNFFTPFPIDERDVRQLHVSLANFVAALRQVNDIYGEGSSSDGNLIVIGQKFLEGFGNIEVHLALVNDDPIEFATRCRGLRSSPGIKKVVVLMPRPVSLTNGQRQLLDQQGVQLISLHQLSGKGELALDWQVHVIAASAMVKQDGFRAPRTIVWKGREHTCDLTSKEQDFLAIAVGDEYIEVHRLMHAGERPLWKGTFRNVKSQRDKISKFLSRFNRKLATAKPAVPLSFSLKRGSQAVQRRELRFSSASSG